MNISREHRYIWTNSCEEIDAYIWLDCHIGIASWYYEKLIYDISLKKYFAISEGSFTGLRWLEVNSDTIFMGDEYRERYQTFRDWVRNQKDDPKCI